MKIITFSLHTQQPLLATSFQGDPNSDVSYSFIPGSMIRGAIIGRYMKQHQLSELDLSNDAVKHLFFDAKSTRYLNAYLLSKEKRRTLPVPRSWFKDKDAELRDESPEIRVYDFSVNRTDEVETPKFVGEGFWTEEGGCVRFYKEKRRINIHNQRDRKQGRSTPIKRDSQTKQLKGEGEIFRYEAIDAGQAFQAVILCEEADADFLKKLLHKSEDLWLGGSQSAGYGHTKISDVNCHDTWDEVSIPIEDRIDTDSFTITLLSDMILRDEWGQYAVIPPSAQHKVPVPLIEELKKFLGVEPQPKISFTTNTLVGGFNRKWGLPLPQVPALEAGSVFVFENISLNLEQIQQLETQGIGERRVEGFGRVVVNWLEKVDFPAKQPDTTINTIQPTLRHEASCSLAAEMAERLLHQKLEQALQKQMGYPGIQGEITNSQLSRLLLVARQALTTGDCDLVLSLLDNLPANARGQFERAKIGVGKDSLKQKLNEWLRDPMSWSWISNPQDLTVKVAEKKRSITDEFAIQNRLAEKYTLRLIMAVTKKAMKEKI
ncbi:MAG: RAMP superfamily CRISPR-associated protein [Nostoc sp.]|uniref:RAMP superfamily CRISPR-associated protein n=1 Tax=Nostoc sp. TaxID=1180 RepID=UPI002FF6DAC8